MKTRFQSILILADIEGSSGCWSRRAAAFKTREWAAACLALTQDVDAVVRALFKNGVRRVTVKDFHRNGYNLLADRIDSRAEIVQGYRRGPIIGIGDPGDARAAMLIGMHAASGTDGFLAHTLTSRTTGIRVNGRLLSEAVLFSGALAPYGVRPVFASGGPIACAQAGRSIAGIRTFAMADKSTDKEGFDAAGWRKSLAAAAIESLSHVDTEPVIMNGPLETLIRMRDGVAAASKLAGRWRLDHSGDTIRFVSTGLPELYEKLVRLFYLTPLLEKCLPAALLFNDLRGRAGLRWVRKRLPDG